MEKSRFSHDAALMLLWNSDKIPKFLNPKNAAVITLEFDEFVFTVEFLTFGTSEIFAVIYLKFKQKGQTLGYFIKKMQME